MLRAHQLLINNIHSDEEQEEEMNHEAESQMSFRNYLVYGLVQLINKPIVRSVHKGFSSDPWLIRNFRMTDTVFNGTP